MFTVKSIKDFLQDLPDDKVIYISINGNIKDINYIDNDNDEIIFVSKEE